MTFWRDVGIDNESQVDRVPFGVDRGDCRLTKVPRLWLFRRGNAKVPRRSSMGLTLFQQELDDVDI